MGHPEFHYILHNKQGICRLQSTLGHSENSLVRYRVFIQKNPRVRKIRVRNSGAGKWLRQFYGRLESAFFLQEKPMSIKFLLLGGGGYLGFFWGGGDFIFMGAGIFPKYSRTS